MAMHDFLGSSAEYSYGFTSGSKKMFWKVDICPTVAGKQTRKWILLLVYDDDHPHVYGGSVKVYSVSPSHEEIMELISKSKISHGEIPHLILDPAGYCIDTAVQSCFNSNNYISSASTNLRIALRWINLFELALLDRKI
ncbi:MAG: hypothetical protein LBU32_26155 [Clostridiales bacterium]|nr:hypothetical protein [Clostridiales bacterium]